MVVDEPRDDSEMPSTAIRSDIAARLTALAVPKCSSRRACASGRCRRSRRAGSSSFPSCAAPGASRWRSDAPRRAAAARNRAPGRARAARTSPALRRRSARARPRGPALGDADGDDAIGNAEFVENAAHRRHLALAAVDQDDVRPGRESRRPRPRRSAFAASSALLLQKPREAALHDLAHHAEIVAGRDVGRADVELAILVLHETFRPGDDHRADRVRCP
jgi:hypothetical protein